jgi:conjugative transfer signal peptidase TraF
MTTLAPPALAVAGALAAAALAAPRGAPAWLWNTTASAPEGLYRLRLVRALAVGDWIAVRPPAPLVQWLAQRGALPRGVLLLKRVAALAPSTVCRRGDRLWVDGAPRATVLASDSRGRLLPQWRPCRPLGADEVLLLNDAPGSLDSRYFGTVPRAAVVAQASPVWRREDGR